MAKLWVIVWFVVAGIFLPVFAQPVPKGEEVLGPSGLSIPRFVSLSVDKAFMRAGPGEQYPIMWVYGRRNYPFEVIAEFDSWRQVRDAEGTEGWMHVILLSGNRTGVVTGGIRMFYSEPSTQSRPVLRAEEGVIGEILECQGGWCRLNIQGRRGWLQTQFFWGTFEGETLE